MATTNRAFVPVLLLASVLGAATGGLAPRAAIAQAAGAASPADRMGEPLVFAGQASVSGRVIRDTHFGAPPVLELIVDLSGVTARGRRSGLAYDVQKQAIVRRPLQPFEQVEVGITLAPQGDVTQARSAVASFAAHYSEAKGLTTTPVKIEPHPSS